MVSFQFCQGINAKSLSRHGNGAIKHFNSEFKQNKTSKIKNPNLLQTQIQKQEQKRNFKVLNERKSLLSYKNRKPHQWVLFQVNTIHKMRCPNK